MNPGALSGRRVLVTRRAPALVTRLSALGVTVIEAPAIAIEPPDDLRPLDEAMGDLAQFGWIVFTSANAVRSVAFRLEVRGCALPLSPRIASVGHATTAAFTLGFPGRAVDLEPEAFNAQALVDAFASVPMEGVRIFLPVSDRAPGTVSAGLEARGALVRRVIAYRTTEADALDRIPSILAEGVDVVAFASPSAVTAYVAVAGDLGSRTPAVVIGPTTAKAARENGLEVVAQANPSTLDGLAETIVNWLTPKR